MTHSIPSPFSGRRSRRIAWLTAGALCLAPLAVTAPAAADAAPAVERIGSGNASCAITYTGAVTIGFHGPAVDLDVMTPDVIGRRGNRAMPVADLTPLPVPPGGGATPPSWRFTIGEGAHATAKNAAVFPLEGQMYIDPMSGVLDYPPAPDPRLPDVTDDVVQYIDNLSVRVDGTGLTMVGDVKATKRGDTKGEGAVLVEAGKTVATGALDKPADVDAADGEKVKLTTLLSMNTDGMVGGVSGYFNRYPWIGPVMLIEATADRQCTLKDDGPVDPGHTMPTTGTDTDGADQGNPTGTDSGSPDNRDSTPVAVVALVMAILGVLGGVAGLFFPRLPSFGFFR